MGTELNHSEWINSIEFQTSVMRRVLRDNWDRGARIINGDRNGNVYATHSDGKIDLLKEGEKPLDMDDLNRRYQWLYSIWITDPERKS